MQYAINQGVLVSVDSIEQLELFGKINRGGEVAVRFNPGIGVGHHEKVVTAGNKTKFGVQIDYIPQVKTILTEHNLKLIGINQHMGSLFLDYQDYFAGVKCLLDIAQNFKQLKFIDFGGGFGVSYRKEEYRLDLSKLAKGIKRLIDEFLTTYERKQGCYFQSRTRSLFSS